MNLQITTNRKLLSEVLHLLCALHDVQSPKAELVLYWLCTQADLNTREVIVVSDRYQNELMISQQNFHNYTRILKNAQLIEGERGLFKLNANIPLYLINSGSSTFNLTINYKLLP